ncbi:S-type pyocin [Pseudomonas sp. PSKL.D1]|uniref:S-type pyocin n=1 Tax=Pseudomonas sp. PSKL.D1 TaxID=3029060 RepID=UPI0023810C77|nr:S-type pyocin [Pseudomonas sp. PSKL.D1]WDY58871.1 S-type pyocin [Pseudomonas sp. PSKL.D1]
MATHLPNHILKKLAGQTFENFDHFSQSFWMAIAEDPVYSQQFTTSQINRIKQGWPPRAPFDGTAKGLRSYEICHLTPPAFGGLTYEGDNLRVMSALQYALSSEVGEW